MDATLRSPTDVLAISVNGEPREIAAGATVASLVAALGLERWPAATSQNPDLGVNPDGSVDIYFGPKAPAGNENNWIQTVPGKGWNTLLRLYGPLQPWFDKTWRPGEIEPVK